MVIRSQFENDADFKVALRDEFAKAALGGFTVDGHSDPANWNWDAIADHAWRAADAMLASRGL